MKDICYVGIECEGKIVSFEICLTCRTEHNNRQLSVEKQQRLEDVRFLFSIQSRGLVRDLLEKAFY
jgi:hypothetical protein